MKKEKILPSSAICHILFFQVSLLGLNILKIKYVLHAGEPPAVG